MWQSDVLERVEILTSRIRLPQPRLENEDSPRSVEELRGQREAGSTGAHDT
jgi:hypothetical protein